MFGTSQLGISNNLYRFANAEVGMYMFFSAKFEGGGVVSKKLLREPGLEPVSSCLLATAAGDTNHCATELTEIVEYTLLYVVKLLFALYGRDSY